MKLFNYELPPAQRSKRLSAINWRNVFMRFFEMAFFLTIIFGLAGGLYAIFTAFQTSVRYTGV